jgi:hypothetical protein
MALYKNVDGEQIRMTNEEEAEYRRLSSLARAHQARIQEYEDWVASGPTTEEYIDAIMATFHRLDQSGASLGQEGFDILQRWKAHKKAAVPKPPEIE